ncbi:pyridoxal phosphate-dependent aminotransferase [Terriglobus saanensis]|uniref:Aminotransferase n=1 Tax=Terriglobus saanensis (strain ATCC BAA-1853 / DSM 23119 / SP1PR4) TaxID=401053 RepID=E8V660_TERSS|nr:aminotransferase class I/II-fold pyridoxal phosphate-dependent enzyme [Terriglobus saanensis]ADV84951.1 aminotransferase class I and II [Terriglobus saanensis SP1PR4]
MGLKVSDLAPRALQSEIRAMTAECQRMGGVNLAQGVCDTDPPEVVLREAKAAMDAGFNQYTRMEGIERLRVAVAAEVSARHGLGVDPEGEVLITSGATGAFHATAMALLNPGDEVIVFEPFYGYHPGTLRALRMVPVVVSLTGDDWALDIDAMRAAVTERTRAVLINTPGNPSGKIFSLAELEAVATLALEHNLFVFTDEIYEHFTYGKRPHIPMRTLPGMRERTITMSGYSKTYSVTGWRIGTVVADARWTPSISYFHDMTYVCAPAPLQHGVAAGLETLDAGFYKGLATEHLSKRTMLVEALLDAGLTPHLPEGAYYILADVSRLPGETASEKARWLLRETGVAGVAGSAFFRPGGGEGLMRFCFAKKDAELKEACERLGALRG